MNITDLKKDKSNYNSFKFQKNLTLKKDILKM